MKKPKLKHFNLFCEVYKVNLMVAWGGNSESLVSLVKRKYGTDLHKTYPEIELLAGATFDVDSAPYHIIWVRELKKDPDNIAILIHELFHHVLRVCESKGIPTYPNIDNLIMDEAAAYLMEFYTRK